MAFDKSLAEAIPGHVWARHKDYALPTSPPDMVGFSSGEQLSTSQFLF